MVEENGLMLNISSSYQDNSGLKKEKRVTAQPANNIFKRKRLREDITVVKKEELQPKKPCRENVEKAHLPPGQVYSTLFRRNPDIPRLGVQHVEQKKEDIFSAKIFKDFDLHPFMVSNLEKEMGFNHATSVQEKAIPIVMEGRDVLMKSQTGSGKTLAYGIPIIQALQAKRPKVHRSNGVHAVILVPTRELAIQSFDILQQLVKPFNWIVPGCIMGGERKKSEKARMRKGVTVLVATPGRLVDHIQNTRCLNFKMLKWLILDEADRLLDMGFEKEVAAILNSMNDQCEARQTILLSATLTQDVERLASIALVDPLFIDIAKDEVNPCPDLMGMGNYVPEDEMTPTEQEADVEFTIPESLKQYYVIVPSKLRLVTLTALILSKCKGSQKAKMLIFLSNRDSVEFHYLLFQKCLNSRKEGEETTEKDTDQEQDLKIFRLHGSMEQQDRKKVYEEFHSNRSGVLLCTDVAARGLDLPNVNWILQYNTPGTPAEYVHRVGRTARVGRSGQAVLFLSPSEVEYIKTLRKLKISLREVDHTELLESLLKIADTNLMMDENFNQYPPRNMEEAATRLQKKFENFVHSKPEHRELAKKAFLSFIRAYATYPTALKEIFHVKKLHLGHTAKSFGLREAPSKFKNLGPRRTASQKHALKQQSMGKQKRKYNTVTSEFQSGLEGSLVSVTHFKAPKKKIAKRMRGNKR